MTGRRNWCKHYRAMARNETCSAGVSFTIFKGTASKECPCWERLPEKCEKSEYRTEAEIAAEDAETQRRFDATALAIGAIVTKIGEYKKGTSPNVSGVIDCPVCGEKDSLRYSRAAYNGHIHGSCSTDDCVRWMM